jgi:hypothetical protein
MFKHHEILAHPTLKATGPQFETAELPRTKVDWLGRRKKL